MRSAGHFRFRPDNAHRVLGTILEAALRPCQAALLDDLPTD